MVEFWYSSYIFLGLALAVGVAIFFVYRDISKKRRDKKENSPLKELERKYLSDQDKGEDDEF
jgi:hypothetical protein